MTRTQEPTLPKPGGHVEGHLQGLLRVQPGVAEGVVAAAQVRGQHIRASTQALSHIVPRHLQVNASWHCAQVIVHIEEGLDLQHTGRAEGFVVIFSGDVCKMEALA